MFVFFALFSATSNSTSEESNSGGSLTLLQAKNQDRRYAEQDDRFRDMRRTLLRLIACDS